MNNKEAIKIANNWFEGQGWKPAPFQKETWRAYLSKKHGLLNAPTGSGKTLALWVPIVLQLLKSHQNKEVKGLKAVWITPLRSLSNEIKIATEKFAKELDLDITVGIRNGDTPTSERQKQLRNFPTLLITTPESFQLLLASKKYQIKMKNLNAFVVDEWHELLGTKRGVQIELAISRLLTVSKELRVWGISATIGNLEQAKTVLLGNRPDMQVKSVMVSSKKKKKIQLTSVIPEEMEAFPWRGHLGLHQMDEVYKIIEKSKTTLVFTNTRSQCELWYQALLSEYGELAGIMAMHHGSIDKELRLWVESAIRNEVLKVVVCTSSLDLGVDFAPVESIIQVGSPKGIARFMQRAGRSGHSPDKSSNIYFVPTYALELIEAKALRTAVEKRIIESRKPFTMSFDVLAQYLVTLAVSDGFYPDDIYEEIRFTNCFSDISKPEWQWMLNYITIGSQSIEVYDEFKKVVVQEDGLFKVESRMVAMRHRMQIGTIVGDGQLKVKFQKGGYIGTVEEWFASKLERGDIFVFAGRQLEFIRIKEMTVQVKNAKSSKKTKVVNWMGGRMALSSQLGKLLRKELENLKENPNSCREFKALHPLIAQQSVESIIPSANQLLVETFKTREGHHLLVYPFEGYHVHEALCSLLAYRISLLQPISFSLAFNDYGFEILSDQYVDPEELIDNNLFSTYDLRDDLMASVNATEAAKRRFRDIAVISGLVFTGFPHKRKKDRHLQSSSQLFFGVFNDYEPDNLLLRQAYSELFEHQIQEERLEKGLERIATQEITIRYCEKPTPFSFPIITDRLRAKLSSEKLSDKIKRMIVAYTAD